MSWGRWLGEALDVTCAFGGPIAASPFRKSPGSGRKAVQGCAGEETQRVLSGGEMAVRWGEILGCDL